MEEYQLYPLKFKTIFKDKIWGGEKIKTILNKDFSPLNNCGETWELSGLDNEQSIVANGFLVENEINELIETYMGDIVGEKVFEKFGNQFPLLIKFIDANDNLSVQVHPNDDIALKQSNSFGKTEAWFVLQADEHSKIITGFNSDIDKETYLSNLNNGTIENILNYESATKDALFFIPAGRIHAIGKGVLLLEIQQVSDITYRIYDWNRTDDSGNFRELHTELALEAIDFKEPEILKQHIKPQLNSSLELIYCQYFAFNLLLFDTKVEKIYTHLDSFVLYICLEGSFKILYDNQSVNVSLGEVILIPAVIQQLELQPNTQTKIIEVYIP